MQLRFGDDITLFVEGRKRFEVILEQVGGILLLRLYEYPMAIAFKDVALASDSHGRKTDSVHRTLGRHSERPTILAIILPCFPETYAPFGFHAALSLSTLINSYTN
jgi:hypothetical protein